MKTRLFSKKIVNSLKDIPLSINNQTMDPLVSERSIAFGEPPIYSSRDFTTVQTSEYPSDRGQWHKSGSRFSISLKNIAQNELIDVNNMSLQFSVVSVVEKAVENDTFPTAQCLPMSTTADAAVNTPGVPAFGVPFISACQVAIPGLGLESFLRSDIESQTIVASRLMCSAGVGSYDLAQGRLGYQISGKAFNAGARDAASRSDCVFTPANAIYTDRTKGVIIGNTVYGTAVGFEGVVTHYSVPMSLFTHLANGLSSMLPISYFSAGGDLLTATFTLAPASSALNATNVDRPDLAGPSTFYVINPCISFTKTQINNPSILASLESLYRGVSSLPIAPGVSAPMAMTLKDIDYTTAYTTVHGPTGAFQLTIPANEPSMRGILLKFSNNDFRNLGLTTGTGAVFGAAGDAKSVGTQWNGKYALGLEPLLSNLVVRIGSYRVPLDAISDIRYDPVNIPGLNSLNPFASFGASSVTLIDCLSTRREAARMYAQGKHLFSPFMTCDNFEDDALAPFWSTPVGRGKCARSAFFGPPSVSSLSAANQIPTLLSGAPGSQRIAHCVGPGMIVIPFESFAAVLNHRSDAFALRGIDLRNITSISVSGSIDGISLGYGPGEEIPSGAVINQLPSTSGWTIRALAAYDREIVLLPGRVDTSAQFSLIPTGATAIPTM